MNPYTVISLFTGIGGIDLAFSQAGFKVVAQVEIDDYCRKVLAKHAKDYWPDATQFADVRQVGIANLPKADVIVGGFPCQDLSIAGKQAGIQEGNRSGLWYEFRRIISELRPCVVFIENVPAIIHNGGTLVISHLTALGYDCIWGVVPASAVGAPHQRERWFCVGMANVTNTRINWWNAEQATDTDRNRQRIIDSGSYRHEWDQELGNPDCQGQLQLEGNESNVRRRSGYTSQNVGNPTSAGRERADGTICPTSEPNGYGRSSQGDLLKSLMGRATNGLSRQLDESRFPARPNEQQYEWEQPRTIDHRTKDYANRIKALGNAVVPQVIYPFAVAIKELLDHEHVINQP